MLQASYTSESWAAQIQNPQDREEQLRQRCAVDGIDLLFFYYSFGEYDVVVIVEAPNNVSVATLAMVVASGGAVKSLKTTILMTSQEGVEAMTRAHNTHYEPPGSKEA